MVKKGGGSSERVWKELFRKLGIKKEKKENRWWRKRMRIDKEKKGESKKREKCLKFKRDEEEFRKGINF